MTQRGTGQIVSSVAAPDRLKVSVRWGLWDADEVGTHTSGERLPKLLDRVHRANSVADQPNQTWPVRRGWFRWR